MIELKEALINKKTLHRAHISIQKKSLEDGDVVLTQNGLFLIYFSKEIIQDKFLLMITDYGYHMKIEDGIFVKPTSKCREPKDYRFCFNYIECVNYNNDLERVDNKKNTIVKIYKKAIDIDRNDWDNIYLDYIDFIDKNKQ